VLSVSISELSEQLAFILYCATATIRKWASQP